MSFWTELQKARKQGKVDNISAKIAKLSLARRGLKARAIKLTHQRETLLGQKLTQIPRCLMPKRPPRDPNPPKRWSPSDRAH